VRSWAWIAWNWTVLQDFVLVSDMTNNGIQWKQMSRTLTCGMIILFTAELWSNYSHTQTQIIICYTEKKKQNTGRRICSNKNYLSKWRQLMTERLLLPDLPANKINTNCNRRVSEDNNLVVVPREIRTLVCRRNVISVLPSWKNIG
jgi:hypothetical protein